MTTISGSINSGVSPAIQASASEEVGNLVLKKALESEKTIAAALIQAIPKMPAVASDGRVGTRVNVTA